MPEGLAEIVSRSALAPWAEGEKIPWHEPEFSARMLREHLSQAHDLASRRAPLIDRHVAWLHGLAAPRARVLDLACGPGLYASRLARLGHECVGLDFSPASIEYARADAEAERLACEYRLHDLRVGGFGAGFGLALLVSGELNVFRRSEAGAILRAASQALDAGGPLVLEVHNEAEVREMGERPPSWYSAPAGLFSDRPHLCLRESAWHPAERSASQRWFVIDAARGDVQRHADTVQAYSDDEYEALLAGAGFGEVARYPSLSGRAVPAEPGLQVFVASASRGDG